MREETKMGGVSGKTRPETQKTSARAAKKKTIDQLAAESKKRLDAKEPDVVKQFAEHFMPEIPKDFGPYPVLPMLKSGKPLRDFSTYKRLRDSKTFAPAVFSRQVLKATEKAVKSEIDDVNETLQSAMEMCGTDDIAVSKYKVHIVRKTNKKISQDKLVNVLLGLLSSDDIKTVLKACIVESDSDFITVTDMAKPRKKGNGNGD